MGEAHIFSGRQKRPVHEGPAQPHALGPALSDEFQQAVTELFVDLFAAHRVEGLDALVTEGQADEHVPFEDDPISPMSSKSEWRCTLFVVSVSNKSFRIYRQQPRRNETQL